MDSELPAPRVEPDRDTRGRLTRVALTLALVGAALVHPIATLLARLDWRADLITHFREPALVLTLLATASLARRHRWTAMALGCLAVAQAGPLFRYAGPNPVRPDARSTDRLRVLLANVFVDNARYEDLDRLIRRERPDVVGLVEVTHEWVEGLAAIRAEYPYRVEVASGPTGLALWFRERPIAMEDRARPLPDAWPFLHAEFLFAGRPRHLWLLHPQTPFVRKDLPELAALAALIGRTRGSRIVIGDMNTTDGSPHFWDFLRVTGLRDSRLGFGRQPSWRTGFPYRITLEHAFVSDDLAVVARRLGPTFGSDHFPMILDLAPATGDADADAGPTSSTSQSGRSPGRGG